METHDLVVVALVMAPLIWATAVLIFGIIVGFIFGFGVSFLTGPFFALTALGEKYETMNKWIPFLVWGVVLLIVLFGYLGAGRTAALTFLIAYSIVAFLWVVAKPKTSANHVVGVWHDRI